MDTADANDWLAERFEENRGHLRAVAYRMLGSLGEADDAVQEAWLRLSRSDTGDVRNLAGWLTTVVARVSLTMLHSRRTRREDSIDAVYVPEPIVSGEAGVDPEHEALLADSVGLALLVVLETLAPAERLSFVLHDMFAVPFEEIAAIVDKTPAAARQLASRARRRVQGAPTTPDPDLARQNQVVRAFSAASRSGDFEALVAILHPDVVLRADYGTLAVGASKLVRGAAAVANQALMFSRLGEDDADSSATGSPSATYSRPVLVNGAAGRLTVVDGKPMAVLGFTIIDGRIVEIDILADPERLAELTLPALYY